MSHRIGRRVRFVLAALMLLTGLLGQAGHDWAHAGVESQRAWSQALETEQVWLAGTVLADGDAESSVQLFAAGKGHTHGDSPDNQQGGLAADHAHSVVFLMPPDSAPEMAGMRAVSFWPAYNRVSVTPSDSPDRPPRTV